MDTPGTPGPESAHARNPNQVILRDLEFAIDVWATAERGTKEMQAVLDNLRLNSQGAREYLERGLTSPHVTEALNDSDQVLEFEVSSGFELDRDYEITPITRIHGNAVSRSLLDGYDWRIVDTETSRRFLASSINSVKIISRADLEGAQAV